MNRLTIAATGAALLATGPLATAQDAGLESEEQKYSYTVGYQIGTQIKSRFSQEIERMDIEVFSRGIQDALGDGESALSPEEMTAVVQARQQEEAAAQEQAAQANMEEGEAFLAENKNREGVTSTDSGLQYEVLEEGDGKMPGPTDTVVVHYRGTLIDGTEFDSSYERGEPATFGLTGIIPGWQEALQLMQEGDRWKVYLPSGLAYGAQGAGGAIGPNEALLFEIELLEVK